MENIIITATEIIETVNVNCIDENVRIYVQDVIEDIEIITNEVGVQGANGISAYQIAVNNGFSGTETEWLSGLNNIIKYPCGEQINSHTPVVLINNLLYKIDNTNPLHNFSFVGFTQTSGNYGDIVTVLDFIITLQGWNLIPNNHYLAGSNGGIILSNNTSGFTKVVGFAQNTNTMLIYKNYTSILK